MEYAGSLAAACGIKSRPPALRAQSLSHWTTKAVPPMHTFATLLPHQSGEVVHSERSIFRAHSVAISFPLFHDVVYLCCHSGPRLSGFKTIMVARSQWIRIKVLWKHIWAQHTSSSHHICNNCQGLTQKSDVCQQGRGGRKHLNKLDPSYWEAFTCS